MVSTGNLTLLMKTDKKRGITEGLNTRSLIFSSAKQSVVDLY